MYHNQVACKGLRSTIRNMEETKPREVLKSDRKEPQEVRILKVPRPLPGVSGRNNTFHNGSAQGDANEMSKRITQRLVHEWQASMEMRRKDKLGRDQCTL